MPMSDDERRRFNEQLDQAVEAAKAALAPVFDKGAYDLSEDELSLLSEVSFKLGVLRIVIIDRDLIADQVEARWQEEKARRAAAVLRIEQRSSNPLR
ncbi:hypothetical protein [Bosea vaviloviae]|uniref:Uncharacterized protein n=1 Tax=Bosea vaviloviae TaxID=1526658 RepID=A0A1D7UCK7_9HYPH|nr:hypothetical protein [Bosea vaviloviae]AOO85111.1 hypothetical protein BHK69_30925 [Bosea vaviloviae]